MPAPASMVTLAAKGLLESESVALVPRVIAETLFKDFSTVDSLTNDAPLPTVIAVTLEKEQFSSIEKPPRVTVMEPPIR